MTLKAVQTPVSPPVSDTEIYALPTSPKSVPQKRKVDDGDGDGDEITATESGAKIESSSIADLDGLSAGRIICETCGEAVTFRDPQSGKLQIEKWDAHKQQCITGDATIAATAAAPRDSVSDTSEVNPSADTESESDATDAERPVNLPPVASIVTSTTAYSQGKPHDMQPPLKRRRAKRTEEERIEYLRSDPYVAHFEPYRVLCSSCDKWIRLRPNSTYCSIPWDAHRKSCLAKKGGASAPPGARNIAFSNDPQVKKFDAHRVHCRSCSQWIFVGADDSAIEAWTTHRAECEQTMVNSVSTPATSTASVPPPSKEQLAFVSMTVSSRSGSMPPPHGLSPRPASPAPPDKSTAEILAAAQAHAQNQPSSGGQESRRRNADQRAAILRQDPLLAEVEPHRVYCSLCQKWVQLRQDSTYCANPWQQHRAKCIIRADKKGRKARDFSARTSGTVGMLSAATFTVNGSRPSDVDTDCTSQGDPMEVDISTARSTPRSASGHALADLDTPAGRAAFVQRSITHLYSTTYERSDDLTLAALLAYLNCAVPLDKHEDFDTAEVLSAATALQARGVLELRGDILRPIFVD